MQAAAARELQKAAEDLRDDIKAQTPKTTGKSRKLWGNRRAGFRFRLTRDRNGIFHEQSGPLQFKRLNDGESRRVSKGYITDLQKKHMKRFAERMKLALNRA